MSQLNWYMAKRYFFAKRSNRFVSWVGGISILGIALGVIALIVTMAILNGFEGEVTRRITNFIPHIVASNDVDMDKLAEFLPAGATVYKSTERKAILRAGEENQVLRVRAIDRSSWRYLLDDHVTSSHTAGKLERIANDLPGIVIGAAISDQLFLSAGDTVSIQSPLDIQTGSYRIPQRHFVVTGIFRSEIFDFDRRLAFIHYSEGRRLFKSSGAEEVHIQLADFQLAQNIGETLQQAFPESSFNTWHDQHRTLFDAMRLEKWGSFIGLNLIILVAVFNIVSSLMMLVLEKTPDIGILRVMGAPSEAIRTIFNLQGYIIAFVGVVIGVVIGTGLVVSQLYWGWIRLPADIYLIPVLPVEIYFHEVLLVSLVAFAIVILSIRYPAKKAAALLPLKAINYKR